MPEQKHISKKGGTMRLGEYTCKLASKSIAKKAYGKGKIKERHRHRYEFNNDYLEQMEAEGLIATGINPDSGLVEIVELMNHSFFIGVQYHPELKSRAENAHPLFVSFVKAAMKNASKEKQVSSLN